MMVLFRVTRYDRSSRSRLLAAVCIAVLLFSLAGCSESEAPQPQTEPTETQDPNRLVVAHSATNYEAPADYFYNEQGQCVRKVQADWDYVTLYAYHENGALMREEVYEGGQPSTMTQYDDHGNPTALYYGSHMGGDTNLQLFRQYTNSYDAQGRLVSCSWTEDEETGETSLYTYHPDGSYDVDFTDYYFHDGSPYVHCHHVASYDSQDRLLRKFEDVSYITPSDYLTVREYDAWGNPVRFTYEQTPVDGYGGWHQIITEYENQCDASGKLLSTQVYKTVYYQTETGSIQEEPRFQMYSLECTYDSSGRLIRQLCTYSPDYIEEEIWEYDSNGNLLYSYALDPSDNSGMGFLEHRYTYLPLSQVLDAG